MKNRPLFRQYRIRLFLAKFRYFDINTWSPIRPDKIHIMHSLMAGNSDSCNDIPIDYFRQFNYIIFSEGNEELAIYENSQPLNIDEILN